MGLDMYLSGKKYIRDYEFQHSDGIIPEDTPAKLTQKACDLLLPVKEISVDVGYWRKANQIHNWFVENVQNGKDECIPHYVPNEKLEELRELCKQVLEDHSKAEELLPTGAGFFFGNTEYDEWYFKVLEDTVAIIDLCLNPDNAELEFEYCSSW